jgi:positive regulator of sigma E activity
VQYRSRNVNIALIADAGPPAVLVVGVLGVLAVAAILTVVALVLLGLWIARRSRRKDADDSKFQV